MIPDFLPKDKIEQRAIKLIAEYDALLLKDCVGTDPWNYMVFLQERGRLNDFSYEDLGDDILGGYNPRDNVIYLSRHLRGELKPMHNFTVSHEIGHLMLHRNLYLKQAMQLELAFEAMPDKKIICTRQNIASEVVSNSLEWQANFFAACLLMPSASIKKQFYRHKSNSPYGNNEELLCKIFHCSKQSLRFRLQELELIDRHSSIGAY